MPGGDEDHGAPAGGRRQEGVCKQHEFVDARALFAVVVTLSERAKAHFLKERRGCGDLSVCFQFQFDLDFDC